MKNLAIIFLFISINHSIVAETNWDELQEVAKNPKVVSAIDPKTRFEIKLIDLGNGKFRIDSFKTVPLSQLYLIYEGKKDLKDLCSDYYLYKNRAFKAKVLFSKNNEIDYSFFKLENGMSLKKEMIENPILSTEIKVRDLSENDKTIWIDKTFENVKMGGDVNQYYVNLFNSHIKNSSADEVQIDLSKLNGLACDIGLGNIKPEITTQVTLEKSLPTISFWLNRELFSEISVHYANMANATQAEASDAKYKDRGHLLLGWSLAQAELAKRTEEKYLLSKVLSNEKRKNDLFVALERNKNGENIDIAWKRTFEIEVPKVKLMTRILPLVVGEALVQKFD